MKSLPVFLRRTYSPTTRTMSACCLTLSAVEPASAIGPKLETRKSKIENRLQAFAGRHFLPGLSRPDITVQSLDDPKSQSFNPLVSISGYRMLVSCRNHVIPDLLC